MTLFELENRLPDPGLPISVPIMNPAADKVMALTDLPGEVVASEEAAKLERFGIPVEWNRIGVFMARRRITGEAGLTPGLQTWPQAGARSNGGFLSADAF